jgi:hypothetical protein
MSLDIIKTLEKGQNRFDLCHQAFKAIRMMHNPGNRVPDTTRDVFQRLSAAEGPAVPVVSNAARQEELEVAPEAAVIEPPVD